MVGLMKKYDVHMCSEVKGCILNNGEPVNGARIRRELTYAHSVVEIDETVTDANGYFSMPEILITSKKPGDMFVHDVVLQRITILSNEETYVLWNTKQLGIEPFKEIEEKLLTLNGDLSSQEVRFTFPNKKNPSLEFDGLSICRWENDFEVFELEDDGTQFFSS